jgi:glycosyltransferase involved in cell wall biosynthesis
MPDNHLLAIPVYNEERYVARVLDQVRLYINHILVVDDGSTDGTPAILEKQTDISVISHPENRGYGQSLADAFQFALDRNYAWLITMDCDEQHEPACIPRFVEAAAMDDADVISGTRYSNGHSVNGPAPKDRREINRLISNILNRRLGLDITDAFCGFKAYRVEALRHFRITVPGYAMPMQWWVQAARAALRIEELPVPLIYKDDSRHFGGALDNPVVRLRHYLEVFETEMAKASIPIPETCGTRRLAC